MRHFVWYIAIVFLHCDSFGQISRSEARRIAATSNHLPFSRELWLWAVTAQDSELIQALALDSKGRAYAAAMEIPRRRRDPLIRALIGALPSTDRYVGKRIVESLKEINLPPTRRALEQAITHRVMEVRWDAASATASWKFRAAAPVLNEAVRSRYFNAVQPLGEVGSKSDWPVLLELYGEIWNLKDHHSKYSTIPTTILSLAKLRNPWALSEVRKSSILGKGKVSPKLAIKLLGVLKEKGDEELLIKCLSVNEFYVRYPAVEVLGQWGSKRAIPILKRISSGKIPMIHRASTEISQVAYTGYVADCIASGKLPISMSAWNGGKRDSVR